MQQTIDRLTIAVGVGAGTPEDLFTLRPGAAGRLHVDALMCSTARALAVVRLLMADTDSPVGGDLSPAGVQDALWGIEGYLEQIRMLLSAVRP